MSMKAIEVQTLGKRYNIGGAQKKADRLGDQLIDWLGSPFRRALNVVRGRAYGAADLHETIWALEDVSFEIRHGEAVGIIGRNGAGKSTLLKILSRITEPTTGYADIYGRVGSLLEVGTGFHPELTGRENIFLNGAILGMKRTEIQTKFDEIVAFAEVEKFIDTPVKHYSSGMYVRLAFSVAAHLEPEILLVDEVLAVGDVAFQKKCLGKMDDVTHEGRTVLFVSHNMGVVQTLCQRGIYLDGGRVAADGPVSDAVDAYLAALEQKQTDDLADRLDRRGLGNVRLVGIEVSNGGQTPSSILKTGSTAQFAFRVDDHLPGMNMNFSIFDQIGQPVIQFRTKDRSPNDRANPDDRHLYICDIEQLLVLPGRYRIDVGIVADNRLQDYVEGATYFEVVEGFIEDRLERNKSKFNVSMPHIWTLPVKD